MVRTLRLGCILYTATATNGKREPSRGRPILPRSIDIKQLIIGDHILIQCTSRKYRKLFWSALVSEAVDKKKTVSHVTVMTNCEDGVIMKEVLISELHNLHKVEYLSCRYSNEESLERAMSRINENHYHPLRNNSHHFVSWCKTGWEHSLMDILRSLEYCSNDNNCQVNEKLNYVMVTSPIGNSTDGLFRGAHILVEKQHYLIESVDTQQMSFSAFSIDQTKRIKRYEGMKLEEVQTTKDSDVQLTVKVLVCSLHCHSSTIEEALDRAKVELNMETKRKWGSSDCFVTAMLCGIQHSISERYLIDRTVAPTGCTLITPKVTVKEGDHLIIKYVSNDWISVIVQEYLDDTQVKIKPPLNNSEMIDLTTHPEIYRIDYSESILPVREVLKRANSDVGNEILRNNLNNQSCFVTWAKTGREIDISEFLNDMPTTKQRKCLYNKVSSFDTIKPGDHLVKCFPSKRRHFMVTECEDGPSFKVIFCDNGSINEGSEPIELSEGQELYRIEYTDNYLAQVTTMQKTKLSPPPGIESDSNPAVNRARSLLGKRMISPWASMLVITWAKTGETEDFKPATPSNPTSKSIIKSFYQLTPGDYLVVEPLSGWTHHYIVVSVESSERCTVIEHFYRGRVSKQKLTLCNPNKFPLYYRINYEEGACLSNECSVNQAEKYVGHTKLPGINYQNFVHFLKTNEKDKVKVDSLTTSEYESTSSIRKHPLGSALHIQRVDSLDLLAAGDHTVYSVHKPPYYCSVYQSAIVTEVLQNQQVRIATVSPLGFVVEIRTLGSFNPSGLYRVNYHSCLPQIKVLAHIQSYDEKGNYNFDEKCNNSHHFATRCKTGQEYIHPLKRVLTKLKPEIEQGTMLKPVLTKVLIESIDDVTIGDHIMFGSQHHLVYIVNFSLKKIETFTTSVNKVINKVEISDAHRKISKKMIFCIKYDPYITIASEDVAIERARTEMQGNSKWQRSDQFVTMMKCGIAHIVDDRCLLSHRASVVGSTRLTPLTSVDEGDHLVIRNMENPEIYHSTLVCSFSNQTCVTIIPPISPQSEHNTELIDLNLFVNNSEVYRMNYSESLPSAEVLKRAFSQNGKNMLEKVNDNCDLFVTWAKIGRQIQVEINELIKMNQIEAMHPLEYRKILSVDEFQVGQHVFFQWKSYKPFRDHYLITKHTKSPTKFQVIRCLRMVIKEETIDLDPSIAGNDIYEVLYQDELPTELALRRARSLLGKIKSSPLSRMWFVPWAKTGSEDGLEIDLMRNLTRPVSKSRLVCFTQLNIGDYVVEENNQYVGAYHHYIVKSIESPEKATVIESWNGAIKEKILNIISGKKVSCEDHPWFYRINYEDGICIPAEESVEKAKHLMLTQKHLYSIASKYSRCSFVHYLTTGESADIGVNELLDDRILLPRELVLSAMDLKPGDHIERPLSLAPKHAQHHMLVIQPIDDKHCEVIHYQVHPTIGQLVRMKKGNVVFEIVNIFAHNLCFRVNYPERIDPEKGMTELLLLCGENGKKKLKEFTGKDEYSIIDNNCEHLVMIATLGFPLSIQVDKFIYQALQTGRGVVRSFRMSCLHHGAHFTPGSSLHACQHIGMNKLSHVHSVVAHGIQKPALSPTGLTCGNVLGIGGGSAGKVSGKVVVKIGAKTAASGSVLGAVAGVSFAVNFLIEAPLLARSIYKLYRQKKFGKITNQEFKRKRDSAIITSVNVGLGGALGAVAGQAAIQVPVVGAIIGGIIGNLVGHSCGQLEAKLFCLLRYPEQCDVTLPEIVIKQFKNYDELDLK